jgi:hypothetical protein
MCGNAQTYVAPLMMYCKKTVSIIVSLLIILGTNRAVYKQWLVDYTYAPTYNNISWLNLLFDETVDERSIFVQWFSRNEQISNILFHLAIYSYQRIAQLYFRTLHADCIDILYTLDSASNYSAIQKLKPWLQTQDIPMKWED